MTFIKEMILMSEGHMKHGALESIHILREGNVIWKLQCSKMKQICGKQALFVSLEGLWENMSPSDPVEPVFQRQHRNHVSYCSPVQWCLAWVFMEPDNQIVLKSSWSHSLWAPSSFFLKRGWVRKTWWVPACRTPGAPSDPRHLQEPQQALLSAGSKNADAAVSLCS